MWSKKSDRTVAFDVKPGSCSSPLVDNPGKGQGKAVVATAILGSADVDVHDIDPQSININGSTPVRWSYGDVGAPADRSSDECACNDARPDGHEDLVLSFYRDDLVEAIEVAGGAAPGSARKHERQIIRVTGEFRDGSGFEGSDCVTLVGNHGPSLSARGAGTNRHSELLGNVPNPFNPETKIGFYLSEPAHVKLEIFNVRGQRVATLVDEIRDMGEQWITWKASGVASGVGVRRSSSPSVRSIQRPTMAVSVGHTANARPSAAPARSRAPKAAPAEPRVTGPVQAPRA